MLRSQERIRSPWPAPRAFPLACVVLLLLIGSTSSALAQEKPASPPVPSSPAPGGASKEPASAEPPRDKNIDDAVKGFEKLSGLFTFYRQKKGVTDTLMLELPEERLGQLLMLQVTASTGAVDTPAGIFHGEPLRDLLFRIEKVDDSRIIFLQPNIQFRAPHDGPTRRTLERSYPDTVLQSFEIKARQPDRHSILIDVGDLFKADIADLGRRFDRAGYTLDRANSYLDSLKVLPANVLARSVYQLDRKPSGPPAAGAAPHQGASGEGPRSFPFAVDYDLYPLPATDYQPRLGDTRVGYFTTSYEDDSDAGARDKTVNYILRWNLEKADPAAPLSPPKKPIVFWIDNAVPAKYRSAIREGLLMWNPALERIGIKDAIVVKQMPDDADWDIADVRYNVVRWTTGMPFAIALFRANPLTGEILNAAINVDAGFVSLGASTYEMIIDPTEPPYRKAELGLFADDPRACTYAADSGREAYFAELAANALQTPDAPFDREAFIHSYIRQVVAHEMGHVLGLRHNLIASTESTFDQLKDARWVREHGVSASVMDYNPPNLAALRQKGDDYFSSVVGRYDLWAIEYGYRPIDVKSTEAERPELARIASQCNWPGHAFQSDEMANAYDPLVARLDLSKNPLDWTARTFEVSRYLLMTLGSREPKAGESYYAFTRDFIPLVAQYFSAAAYTARFIGGLSVSSNFHGDPAERPPLLPIEGAQQRRALDLLNRYVFAEKAFAFPKAYYSMLAGDPNVPGNQPGAADREFPVFDFFAKFQRRMLGGLFEPALLDRLENNEFRAAHPEETLTMATLFRSVGDEVWSELRTGREIGALRRSLQVDHLNLLIDLVIDRDAKAPPDAITLAWEQLHLLKGRIAAALPTARGEYGAAHLGEALARIQGVLAARPVARP